MTGRRILFTNVHLDRYAGTECVTRDLAAGMLRRGHQPVVYSPKLGRIAEEIRSLGVPVVDDLRLLTERPDVIHGHHYIQTAEAVIHFPEVPALSICHAWINWVESPPRFPQIRRYGAVSEATRDRLVIESGIPTELVTVFPNSVDLHRFPVRTDPLPERPRRLLAFTVQKAHLHVLEAVAEQIGAELAVLDGSSDSATADPGELLRRSDLVFATGRSAIEALASGCAVVVGDAGGLGGLVTTADFERMRAANFAMRALTRPFNEETVLAEVERYHPQEAAQVTAILREVGSLERQLDTFEDVHASIIEEARRSPCSAEDRHAALRDFLTDALPRTWPDPRWPWQAEKDLHVAERDALLTGIEDLRNAVAVRDAELNRVWNSRGQRRRELKDALRRSERELAEARAAVLELTASRSWRWTAPLRRLKRRG